MALQVAPITLEGHKVLLEPIAETHIDGLYAAGSKHREDWQYLPVPGFPSRGHAEEWVRDAIDGTSSSAHLVFVVRICATGEVAGSSRYLNIRSKDRALEIGYTWIARHHQKTFVNTEAKYLMLKHAFEKLSAIRVELKTDLRNTQSQNAIQRLGARKEGILRRHMIAQGGYIRDSVVFSITDLDWPETRTMLERKLRRGC